MARLRPAAGGDRAQVLLVGAFALALLLVALATVLNGAAVTETLAGADGSDAQARAALGFERDVDAGVGGLVAAVNRRDHANRSALDAAVADAVAAWDEVAAREAATSRVDTSVTLLNVTDYGTAIAQDNASRTLTDANDTANWTLASDAAGVATARFNLSRASLAPPGDDGATALVVDNGTTTWRATLAGNDTHVIVTVDGPSGTETCSVAADAAVLDLTAGTLGGEPCPALDVQAALAGPYDVAVENGTAAAGSYQVVVDADVPDDDRFADDGDPSVSPAALRVRVAVSYVTPRMTYTTELTVGPGDDDA